MIYTKIATERRTRINSDDYAVGDMLPSEKALAAELKAMPPPALKGRPTKKERRTYDDYLRWLREEE